MQSRSETEHDRLRAASSNLLAAAFSMEHPAILQHSHRYLMLNRHNTLQPEP
jgi:hypothetical protein